MVHPKSKSNIYLKKTLESLSFDVVFEKLYLDVHYIQNINYIFVNGNLKNPKVNSFGGYKNI